MLATWESNVSMGGWGVRSCAHTHTRPCSFSTRLQRFFFLFFESLFFLHSSTCSPLHPLSLFFLLHLCILLRHTHIHILHSLGLATAAAYYYFTLHSALCRLSFALVLSLALPLTLSICLSLTLSLARIPHALVLASLLALSRTLSPCSLSLALTFKVPSFGCSSLPHLLGHLLQPRS